MELLLLRSVNGGQRGRLCAVTEAGQPLQCSLSDDREPAQLADHEIDDVIRVAFGSDGSEVPAPSGIARLEGDQIILQELLQELIDEEGIAPRLLMDQVRQRLRRFGLTMKSVDDPLGQRFTVER